MWIGIAVLQNRTSEVGEVEAAHVYLFISVGVFSVLSLNSVYLLLSGVKESAPFQSKSSGSP